MRPALTELPPATSPRDGSPLVPRAAATGQPPSCRWSVERREINYEDTTRPQMRADTTVMHLRESLAIYEQTLRGAAAFLKERDGADPATWDR